MTETFKMKSLIRDTAIKSILKINYFLNNYREVIWLLGDARSGTTWVADMINFDKSLREMFEPFHPLEVSEMAFLKHNQYYRKGELDESMLSITQDIVSGKFTHNRVDGANQEISYRGILIKDIYANLLSYSVCSHFSNIKPILLIRNPFSVALSKSNKKGGLWPNDPKEFLQQSRLVDDYLYPFEDIINKTSAADNYILNQILIWAVLNYVPIKQFNERDIHVCFYESIYLKPNEEIMGIRDYLSNGSLHAMDKANLSDGVISKPSRFTHENSPILMGHSPISNWKNELPRTVIDRGYEILDAFHLADLYDNESMPNQGVIDSIRTS